MTIDLHLPDAALVEAYTNAAERNVLAAVNPQIFDGYWSVCADGVGHGRGNTYPALDGHQMTDALLALDQVAVVKANWDYVRHFQKPDGQLPFAILPALAGQSIGMGPAQSIVDPNGGLYRHWVPGDPLRATGSVTYIQNADVIFRRTQDRGWLAAQLPSVNRAADQLRSLVHDGLVGGAGYYVERPTRIESDGVTQCLAVDAWRRLSALNACAGEPEAAARYARWAETLEARFRELFWTGDQFAEYIHPQHGRIARHGLTDVDWAAVATGVASPRQVAILWPRLRHETRFYYGGMPTGIATQPGTYEPWECTHPDQLDLAAMGRVWYLEAWARWRQGDAAGLQDTLARVLRVGRAGGWSWRERYQPDGQGAGVEKYCEYPANLIRIVQRFVLGVAWELDGSLTLHPVAPAQFWERGFGQTLHGPHGELVYRLSRDGIGGTYRGRRPLRLRLAGWGEQVLPASEEPVKFRFNQPHSAAKPVAELVP